MRTNSVRKKVICFLARLKRFSIGLLLLVLVGCSSDTEQLKPAPLLDIDDPLKVKKVWSKDIGEGLALGRGKYSPLVLADRVVGIDERSKVTALSLEKGKKLWSLSLEAKFGSGVGGDNLHVVVAGLDGQVYLIDTRDGKLVWKAQAASEVLSVPTLNQYKVIVQSADGSILAFNRANGDLEWRYQVGIPVLTLRGSSSPKIWKERVLAGFSNGKMVALDIHTGEPIWEQALGAPTGRTELDRLVDLDGEFLIKDEVAYAVSYQGVAAAIELYSGRVLWSEKMSSTTGVTEFAGQLYVTDDRGHIWALNSRTGTILWSNSKLQGRQLSAPIVSGDFLVVSDFEGYVHWLGIDTGETRSRKSAGDAPISMVQNWASDQIVTFSADAKISVFGSPD